MKLSKELDEMDIDTNDRAYLKKRIKELEGVAEALLEWIDAVPEDTPLPAMPGVDRDWVNEVLSKGQRIAELKQRLNTAYKEVESQVKKNKRLQEANTELARKVMQLGGDVEPEDEESDDE